MARQDRSTKSNDFYSLKPDGRTGFYGTVYVGIVKENKDVYKMGRISVYIPELEGNPDDRNSWHICTYVSPFAGATNPNNLRREGKTEDKTQSSYGFWMPHVDIGNEVLVAFANGAANRGMWLGCLFPQNMNFMVPGTASCTSHQGKFNNEVPKPVAEYNKKDLDQIVSNVARPNNRKLTDGLAKQGLWKDTARGVTDASARRESPSDVFGWRTRKGFQQYVDEGDENQYMRFRTPSGAQIIINETYGFIYIINRDGSAWVELQEDGHIDVYSKLSVNIHSEKDINLRADRDINIESGRNTNIKAVGETAPGDITMQAQRDINNISLENIRQTSNRIDRYATGLIHDFAADRINIEAGNNINQFAGKIDHNTSSAGESARSPQIPIYTHNNNRKVIKSIDSRVPEHEPWFTHQIFEPETQLKAKDCVVGGSSNPVNSRNTTPPPVQPPGSTAPIEPGPKNIDPCGILEPVISHSLSQQGERFILTNRTLHFYGFRNENGSYDIGYLRNQTEEIAKSFERGITEKEAWDEFKENLKRSENIVKKSRISVDISKPAYDALVSLVDNLGVLDSPLIDAINSNNIDAVYNRWVSLPGNSKLRSEEANLYKSCEYPPLETRCDKFKEALEETPREYGIQTTAPWQEKQIEFSFYRQGFNIYLPSDDTRKKFVVKPKNELLVTREIGKNPVELREEDDPCKLEACNFPFTDARGLRNNNPGNIERTTIQWAGTCNEQKDERFLTFEAPEWGIRAMVRILRNYQSQYNINTLNKATARWAPWADNNNPVEYAALVGNLAGIGPDQVIDFNDDGIMERIIPGFITKENGSQPYSNDVIRKSIILARRSI